MTEARNAAEVILDDIVNDGMVFDVFEADQARLLLVELDRFVGEINQTGLGKEFLANLQRILQRDLVLGITRLYEPFSARKNPGRSLPAAVHHIKTHAAVLRILERRPLLSFLIKHGETRPGLDTFSDEQLSRVLVGYLDLTLARPDSASGRSLDHALAHLKAVRDKRIAHHDRVRQSSLLIPGWLQLVELVDGARETVEMVAAAYLGGNYNLAGDAKRAVYSLRQLLSRAGLQGGTTPGPG